MKYKTRVRLKPLSINKGYKGKLQKTDALKQYERDLFYLLPRIKPDCKGRLKISITYGFSSRANDLDNPTKPFLDVLQRKYGFNDNQIYRLTIKKKIVPKGREFIDFKINNY